MAKESMVTRTIRTTKATALVVELNTNSTSTVEVVIPGVFKSADKLLKVVREKVDTDTRKTVAVTASEIVSALYGMSETVFLENAQELPPRKNYKNETEKGV